MADETPPLDDARLAEIRQRADAATPGPWHIHLGFIWPEYAAPYHEDHDDSITGWTNRDADRTFIANAREDIPALLAAYDRLRAERTTQQAAVEGWYDKWLSRERTQQLLAEVDRSRAREAAARAREAALVKIAEAVAKGPTVDGECPWCFMSAGLGHDPDECLVLKARALLALGAAEGEAASQ